MTQLSSQKNRTTMAVCLLVAGSLAYAVASLMLRLAGTDHIGTFGKAFLRNSIVLLFATISLRRKGLKPSVRPENRGWMLSRAALGTVSAMTGYYAVDHLMLADATMLSLLGPLFTVACSAILLKERTNRKQKLLLAAAVFGMLLVVRPSGNFSLLFPMLMGITSAVTYGCAFSIVRLLQTRGEDSRVVVFWYALVSTAAMIPLALRDTFAPTWTCLLLVLLSGTANSVTQLLNTRAYGMAPARTLSACEYTQLPFAAILGWLVLSEVPGISSFIGYVLIITVSILTLRAGGRDRQS